MSHVACGKIKDRVVRGSQLCKTSAAGQPQLEWHLAKMGQSPEKVKRLPPSIVVSLMTAYGCLLPPCRLCLRGFVKGSKFGDGLRSKTDVAMVNETLCKILCHNLVVLIYEMCELATDPVFWPMRYCQ
jgi:hypothetical protein